MNYLEKYRVQQKGLDQIVYLLISTNQLNYNQTYFDKIENNRE